MTAVCLIMNDYERDLRVQQLQARQRPSKEQRQVLYDCMLSWRKQHARVRLAKKKRLEYLHDYMLQWRALCVHQSNKKRFL